MEKVLNHSLRLIFAILFFTIYNPALIGQQANSNNSTNEKWLTAKLVADKVWCIDDHGGDNMYLVEGDEKALLIDAGRGLADLKSFVQTLTSLPIIVVNTHGHPDHAGNDFQFDQVYAHPNDFQMIAQFTNKNYHDGAVAQAIQNSPEFESQMVKDMEGFDISRLVPVREGYVFDLGNRKLEVIEVPAHTQGSIVLLDSANKIIFTGDNNNNHIWLFLEGCSPVESYLEILEKLKKRSNEFDIIMPGHTVPLDKTFIDEQIACVKMILSGECKGTKYENSIRNAMQCTYKRALIAFNPENVYKKP